MTHILQVPFSRRQFIQNLGLGAALSLLHFPLSALAESTAFNGRKLLVGSKATEDSAENLSVVDLASGDIRMVPLNLKPHSFVAHPLYANRVWVIERGYDKPAYDSASVAVRNVSAAEVDIVSGDVLQYIAPPADSRFFGHGFFTPDGTTLFISRVDMNSGQGFLTGYDPSGKMITDYPVAQGAVHEIRLLKDGTVLAAGSGIKPLPGKEGRLNGPRLAPGALLYIDLSSGKVLERQLVEDDTQMVGHFHRMDDDTLIMLSRPRPRATETPGRVFTGMFGSGASLQAVPYTDVVGPGGHGECLSLAVDERGQRALVTNPENKRILVLDTKTRSFTGEIPLHSQGVTFHPGIQRFIAGMDELFLIDAKTQSFGKWSPQKHSPSQHGPFNSAHNFLL